MRLFEVIVLATSVVVSAKASFVSGPRPLWYPIPLSGRSLTDQGGNSIDILGTKLGAKLGTI